MGKRGRGRRFGDGDRGFEDGMFLTRLREIVDDVERDPTSREGPSFNSLLLQPLGKLV